MTSQLVDKLEKIQIKSCNLLEIEDLSTNFFDVLSN